MPPRSHSAPSTAWTDRHRWGTALRGLLALAPTLAAVAVTIGLARLLPDDAGLLLGLFLLVCIGAAGFGAATATAAVTTRLLPLAALLKLSLVFPDHAPSRFRLAMKATSSRRLKLATLDARQNGLSDDATIAAEQIILLTAAVGEHDRKTRGHSERVRVLSRLIGEEMKLSENELEVLQWGAMLHDIGKLTVAPQILNKSDVLTPTEWAILQHHPAAGRELIAPLEEFLGDAARTTDGHHERWDGTGYPSGLRGSQIPLPARIVAVADAFEVMTSFRAYKKPLSAERARAELTASAGSHFDPDVVRAMLTISIGPLRWATGPVALAMSLPLIGEAVGLFARAGFQLGGSPAAAAAAVPATATAASITVAAAAGVVPMPQQLPPSELPALESTTSLVARIPTDAIPSHAPATPPATAPDRISPSDTRPSRPQVDASRPGTGEFNPGSAGSTTRRGNADEQDEKDQDVDDRDVTENEPDESEQPGNQGRGPGNRGGRPGT